ncbi:MAG: SIR2 family protein [Methylococcaceae bacterium]
MNKKPRYISQNELLQVFSDLKNHNDGGMCFLLGAGASVNSGIPSGSELAREWYNDLKNILLIDDLSIWQQEIGFDEERIAEFYPQIYEKRFNHPATGFYYLQKRMNTAKPSIGYAVLAHILAETNYKFVVTTNFDYMIEDAIRFYTNERPLICGHESLAEYIDAHSIRPTIIKVHRDLLLKPFNNSENTDKLDESLKKTLEPILQHCHLVVIGYGGNDNSVMNFLKDANYRKGVYWCYRDGDIINNKISNSLNNNDDYLVKIDSFDEFMLALSNKILTSNFFNLFEIDEENLQDNKFIKNILIEIESCKNQLKFLAEKGKINHSNDKNTHEALLKLFGLNNKEEANLEKIKFKINQEQSVYLKQSLYEKSLELLPNNFELICDYAEFLNEIRNYELASKYYIKALKIDSNNFNINKNYALFLHLYNNNYELADKYYRIALGINDSDNEMNCRYAGLLLILGKKEEALNFLEKVMLTNEKNLLLLCWIYRLAYFPEWQAESRKQIDNLLEQGANFAFQGIIAHVAQNDIKKELGKIQFRLMKNMMS